MDIPSHNFIVDDKDIKKKISNLSPQNKELYDFIKSKVLTRIPNNPHSDKAFHCLSNIDPTRPIYLYQKGNLTLQYRIDSEKGLVHVLKLEYKK